MDGRTDGRTGISLSLLAESKQSNLATGRSSLADQPVATVAVGTKKRSEEGKAKSKSIHYRDKACYSVRWCLRKRRRAGVSSSRWRRRGAPQDEASQEDEA